MNNNTSKRRYLHYSVALLTCGLLFYSSFVLAEDLEELQECGSCHTDQTSEFEASVHYVNRSGVQAACNNCHKGQQHKAGKETAKNVQTPRMDMAMVEWKRMKENDSKECNSCHSHMAMDLAKQEPRSVERHEESFKSGEISCINCHKGISHYLPSGWKEIAKQAGLQK